MGAVEHRIGRVIFDFPAFDQAAFDGFGAMVRARFDAVIVPALEAALDRIDRPGVAIRLGRVEIDLGMLESAVPNAGDLARRIVDGLTDAFSLAAGRQDTDDAPPPGDDIELAAFLETGELPWVEPGMALTLLAEALMKLDAAGMRRLAARLRTMLIRRRAAERFVRQMPAALVRRLFRALLPEALAAPLAGVFGSDGPSPHDSTAPAAEGLVPRLVDAIQATANGSRTLDLGETIALFVTLDSRMPRVSSPPPVDAQSKPPTARVPLSAPEPEDREPPRPAGTASLPVHAAGAVLLHPFLGTFFNRLDLLATPDRFHDREAMVRAVLLSHHLATGAEEMPEPETVLFKLLCGMEASLPLPRRIDITDREREETLSVLTNVITHWHRLGQTSPAGLRESFLSRPGQLQRQGSLWRLTVERRGVDILLDHLPWALSWVRTPFMRSSLTVDWR